MRRTVLGWRSLAIAVLCLCSTLFTIHLSAQTSGAPTHPWRDGTGGNNWAATRIATDQGGNVYSVSDYTVAGYQNFTRRMVFQKRDRNDNLLYSVQYGASVSEFANAIAVDANGNLYVTGTTNSPDFQFTAGDPNATNQQYHAFIMKLDPAGTLIYGYGIGDLPTVGVYGRAIAVDDAGNAYVALTRSLGTSTGNRDTVGRP